MKSVNRKKNCLTVVFQYENRVDLGPVFDAAGSGEKLFGSTVICISNGDMVEELDKYQENCQCAVND